MTELKTTIRHADTDIPGIFARITEEAFGGQVCILPSVAILNNVRRLSRRPGTVELEVVLDAKEPENFTIYKIDRALILVDGDDNSSVDLSDDLFDDDLVDEFCANYPQAEALARKYVAS
jgi:hypothetical protein